jgi:hypothetical protein
MADLFLGDITFDDVFYPTNPPPTDGSPYTLATWAFDNAWTVARQKSATSDALFYYAQSAASSPTISPASIDFTPVVVEPPVEIPATADGTSIAEVEQTSAVVINQLVPLFTGYLDTYFGDEGGLLANAEAWIQSSLAGGTGIPVAVEDQIWQRDRARVIAEGARIEDELVTSWAAKGYDYPPGALMHQQQQLRKDAADRLSAASRDVAIKQAELVVANVRFAVEKAVGLYSTALAAAADYIRSLSIGPQSAVQLAGSTTNAQAALISASNGYYQSRIEVEKLRLDALRIPSQWDQEARTQNAGFVMEEIKSRVASSIAAAQSLGQQAASALNSLHAGTSVSGSASNSVGYSYSNDTQTAAPTKTSA